MENNEQWQGAELEAKSSPITEDPGGDPRIIRQFWFSFNPDTISKIKKKQLAPPSQQELFNAHIKQIEVMLWGDGLQFDTDFEPRLVIGKKKYKIVVVCKLRRGVQLGMHNEVHNLTNILKSP